jgi:hypothetical protein
MGTIEGDALTAARYEIVVRGRLGKALWRSFDGMEVRASGPDGTYVRGKLDQAGLQGVLTRLGELGVELSEVRRLSDRH